MSMLFFFFSSRRRHTRFSRDWSSDVCSSDLGDEATVNVYPNPGVAENVEAYGADHVAAQRTIGKEEWQDICPERTDYLVWLKARSEERRVGKECRARGEPDRSEGMDRAATGA